MLRAEDKPIVIDVPKEGAQLDILVENMGRINYGPYLKDYKGITQGVGLGNQFLFDWTIYSLPMEDLSGLRFDSASADSTNNNFKFPGFSEVF